MILQALTRYYEDLLTRGEIAAPGWSPAKISFALCLDENGAVIQTSPANAVMAEAASFASTPLTTETASASASTIGETRRLNCSL